MNTAYRARGIPVNSIDAFAAGGAWSGSEETVHPLGGAFGIHYQRQQEMWLEERNGLPVNYTAPALPEYIDSAFDRLSVQAPDGLNPTLKSGDHLHVFITDHGNERNQVVLWHTGKDGAQEQHYLTLEKFQKYLDALPEGVTTHIATHMCYGGQLLELTRDDVCVVANQKGDRVSWSDMGGSPYVERFAESFGGEEIEADTDKSGKVSIVEAHRYAASGDKSRNLPVDSLTWFINKESGHEWRRGYFTKNQKFLENVSRSMVDLEEVGLACDFESSFRFVESLARQYMGTARFKLSGKGKEAERRIKQLEKELVAMEKEREETLPNLLEQWNAFQQEYRALRSKFHALSEQEQQRRYREFFYDVQDLKKKMRDIQRDITAVNEAHEHVLRTLWFFNTASSEKMDEYLGIERCLQYEM
jgi:hypothetical protein